MKIVARTPASRAAQATAWPWLPALAATTPAARSSSASVAILLTAPRTLNAPVRCRFSAFSQTSRPASRENVSDPYTGVTRAIPSRRRRASWMSPTVGAVFVAKVKHLLHDLAHGGHRVELSSLHLVEQASQLGIVGDRGLEVLLRTSRRDREHLSGEVPAAAALELPLPLEVGAMLFDL